ncbi:hypothetical protein WN943_006726 [Citrus x changshan-huyou]
MINGIPADIRWLIEAKVRLAGEFPDPFSSYMPGFGKSTFAKKRRAKRLGSECSHCVRLACKNPRCKALGMVSVNREDKIKFVKDSMKRKLHLVYGGGDRGLSKLVSEAAFVRGSQVLGIIPKALKPLGWLPDSPTGEELVVSGIEDNVSFRLERGNS